MEMNCLKESVLKTLFCVSLAYFVYCTSSPMILVSSSALGEMLMIFCNVLLITREIIDGQTLYIYEDQMANRPLSAAVKCSYYINQQDCFCCHCH